MFWCTFIFLLLMKIEFINYKDKILSILLEYNSIWLYTHRHLPLIGSFHFWLIHSYLKIYGEAHLIKSFREKWKFEKIFFWNYPFHIPFRNFVRNLISFRFIAVNGFKMVRILRALLLLAPLQFRMNPLDEYNSFYSSPLRRASFKVSSVSQVL